MKQVWNKVSIKFKYCRCTLKFSLKCLKCQNSRYIFSGSCIKQKLVFNIIVTTYTGTDSSKRQIEINIGKKTFINNAIGVDSAKITVSVVYRKQAYFIDTNRGYEVYRKQAYFIDTVAMRYTENRHSTLLATNRGYEVCRKQVYFFPQTKKITV
jgi:hypothetical protein